MIDSVLSNKTVQKADIPILILINKIDKLELNKDSLNSIYNLIDYNLLRQKHFLVKDISALKNIRLEESIRWLFNSMMDYAKTEEDQVESYINLV